MRARAVGLEEAFAAVGTAVLFISATTGEGVDKLMAETVKVLKDVATEPETGIRIPKKVFRPHPRSVSATVHKDGDTFVVVAPGLERITAGMDVTSREAYQQLRKRLARLGVSKSLEKAGIKPGDRVRCGELEWEW